jgi:hypothetical protein
MSRIRRLRRRIQQLRASKAQASPAALVRLTRAIGRVPDRRGKEPTFVMPPRPPLTIPHHGKIGNYTVAGILDQLDEDLDYVEAMTDE